jgi:hypothetical protein
MSLILSGTDGLSDVDGSAATPAIRGTDANTGIFFPAADTIAFAEGGAEVARFDSSGNFGIGTTVPVGDANRVVAVAAAGGAGFFMYDTNQGSTVTDGANIQVAGTNFYLYNKEAGFVAFGQNNTERMRIDSSGNLGIGTASPATKLHVYGSGANSRLENSVATSSTQFTVKNTVGTVTLGLDSSTGGGFGVANAAVLWYDAAQPLVFGTNNTERARIDSSGNLIVGGTSPTTSSGYTSLSINNATNSGYLVLQSNGTNKSDWFVSSGTVATLRGVSVPLSLESTGANHIKFETNATERARIDSSGNLLVGTTTAGAGTARMYVNGDATNPAFRALANTTTTSVYAGVFRHESTTAGAYIQFVTDSNVETGRIYDLAGTMQYASSSDARLKTNVQPMQNGLQSVLALNPCTFDMRRGEDTFISSSGLIAQEVHEVYPFVVGVGGDDENTNPWSVDYGKLTPLLVAAIKEQQALITQLTARITALESA